MSDNPSDLVREIFELAAGYDHITGDHNAKVRDAGLRVIEAVREIQAMLEILGDLPRGDDDDGSLPPNLELQTVKSLVEKPSGLAQYESLVMIAALTHLNAEGSDRTVEQVLDELTKNFTPKRRARKRRPR